MAGRRQGIVPMVGDSLNSLESGTRIFSEKIPKPKRSATLLPLTWAHWSSSNHKLQFLG